MSFPSWSSFRRWNCSLFGFLSKSRSTNSPTEPALEPVQVNMEKLIGFNPSQKLLGGISPPDPKDCEDPKGIRYGPEPPPSREDQDTAVPLPNLAADCIKPDCVACQAEQASASDQDPQRWKYHRALINKERGLGLVAREFIPAGSIIYADQLISLTKREEEADLSRAVNTLLSDKVTAMGPDWRDAYLSMPNDQKGESGTYAGIWDRYHLPVYWNGEAGGVLGFNLAFTNHSCLPNANLTLVNKYRGKNGRQYKKPKLAGAVVRSFVDIDKGQEITISYFYGKGEAEYRRLYALDLLGFRCACRYCLYPNPEVEDALGAYYRLDNILSNASLVSEKPAVAYHAAHEITEKLTDCGIADPRLAMIWAKCALVAGFHSDIGRIRCFLLMVLKLTEVLQGPTGQLFHRAIKWFESMSVMPGFGMTTKGLSAMRHADVFLEHRTEAQPYLFMVGARPDEYIRVNRYLRVPDEECEDEDAPRFEIIPDINPRLKIRKKTRKRRTKKTRERCSDPEKDFLSLWLCVVNDFVDQYAGEQDARKKGKVTPKSREISDKAPQHRQQQQCNHDTCCGFGSGGHLLQLVIHDVGARKQMMWKRMPDFPRMEEIIRDSI